ncbi:MAG: UvrD-helicase domain-containing protein [Anaerolineaceae bacterium]|nr:UvrD-helicase domain-containing protein [Anaerolineaceae bacterium]
MAKIFPDTPFGTIPSYVLRVFQYLKKLPDEYTVWYHLNLYDNEKPFPMFLVINPQNRAIVLQVSNIRVISQAEQLLLLPKDQDKSVKDEEEVLKTFFRRYRDRFNDVPKINPILLFPNIKKVIKKTDKKSPVVWIGKEFLQPSKLERWSLLFNREILNDAALKQLRKLFCPEIIVPEKLTVRFSSDSKEEFLLDLDQEWIAKKDIALPSLQQSLSKNLNLHIVNGVAGSGKTLILLYRLKLISQFFPDKKFLVLTHNKPLIHEMETRFQQISSNSKVNIQWYTFFSWARRWFGNDFTTIVSNYQKKRIIAKVHAKFLENSSISENLLASEIDWFKDQGFISGKEYLNADRRGRGFAVHNRPKMVQAIKEYQKLLKKEEKKDWGDIPILLRSMIENKEVKIPQYDYILIDEAQFFAPVWFEIVRKVLKPDTGSIFIVADPTQGFLRRGTSWKSLGFSVYGRTHRLERSYRNTWEILNFATVFYRSRMQLSKIVDEDIVSPNLTNMLHGKFPFILPVNKIQDEIPLVIKEIKNLISRGIKPEHILIYHPSWDEVMKLVELLNNEFDFPIAANPQNEKTDNTLRITTINAGTGLESPIVFIMGIYQLFEQEQNIRISQEERDELIQENTKKIYMALTRAGNYVFITYRGEVPNFLVQK